MSILSNQVLVGTVLTYLCRLEPVGVLVFSIIMITAFAQVGLESINRIIKSTSHEVLDL